jgi:hypothetical protein
VLINLLHRTLFRLTTWVIANVDLAPSAVAEAYLSILPSRPGRQWTDPLVNFYFLNIRIWATNTFALVFDGHFCGSKHSWPRNPIHWAVADYHLSPLRGEDMPAAPFLPLPAPVLHVRVGAMFHPEWCGSQSVHDLPSPTFPLDVGPWFVPIISGPHHRPSPPIFNF